MGCFSSKKRPSGSPNANRTLDLLVHPRFEPSVKPPKGDKGDSTPLPPLPLPQPKPKKKLRSAKRAPAGNDKNTKPTSVSRSTKDVPVQRRGGGGAAAMGFKGRKVGASTPPKSQPLGGKSKKANKGAKSSK